MNERSVPVSRAALDDLKSKQVAFLHMRLVSPAARAEWRMNVAKVFGEMLEVPLGQLVETNDLVAAIDTLLVQSVLDTTLQPMLLQIVQALRAILVAEQARIGTFVPPNAQRVFRDLAACSSSLTVPLVREISEHEAARLVMSDVLHDALVQFSDRVNPFVADWGLPSLLKKFSPFGLGGVSKSIDGMRVEFERRLEPEIRKFLIGFSREALRKGASSITSQSDTPAFIALRQRIVAFLFEQRFADVLLDERDTEAVTRAALDAFVFVCTDDKLAQRRRKIVKEFVDANSNTSVRNVLVALGAPDKPPAGVVETFADATFPVFAAALASGAGKSWLEGLVAEFYDGLVALDESSVSS